FSRDWSSDVCSSDLVTMLGRRSELLQVGAKTWYPRDIEEALATIPGVIQAAVVGVPDAALKTRPIAYVQTDTPLDGAAVKAQIEIGRASCRERGETT